MKTMEMVAIGGAALAALYFFGSSAQAAAPAAPAADPNATPTPGTADYNTQTGQGAANYGTGSDYQSHNPGGFSVQRFMKRHPNFRRQHPNFNKRVQGRQSYGDGSQYGGFLGPYDTGGGYSGYDQTDDYGYSGGY